MHDTMLQIHTLVTPEDTLEVRLDEVPVPEPAADEVLVRVEAAPINPSDLGLLFGAADMTTAEFSGTDERPRITAAVAENGMRQMAGRVGQVLPVGNEGAGTVVAAGADASARALVGRVVGLASGGTYAQFRCAKVAQVLPMDDGVDATQAASCFVNPMTALGMVETMKRDGHSALVHTAAASNLGQMLNRICQADGIPLVNVVRKPDQVELLRAQGAAHVVNSSRDSFPGELEEALRATGATLAFDAIGGGRLVSQLLGAMERVALAGERDYSRYGTAVMKQAYIYGALDYAPTVLHRNFGFSWSVAGWLLPVFLQQAGPEIVGRMSERVRRELTTTFASHYSNEVSLAEALSPAAVASYGRRATGEKFLIRPHR